MKEISLLNKINNKQLRDAVYFVLAVLIQTLLIFYLFAGNTSLDDAGLAWLLISIILYIYFLPLMIFSPILNFIFAPMNDALAIFVMALLSSTIVTFVARFIWRVVNKRFKLIGY